MIILILAISVIMIVLGAILINESVDYDELGRAIVAIFAVIFVVSFIVSIGLGISVSDLKVIDQKIEMYEKENAEIEEKISEAVRQYQEYETGVFAEVKPESSITLVSLYPDLKADALVQKQIEVYLENNEKIKKLKEKKINGNVTRWRLYFGGEK